MSNLVVFDKLVSDITIFLEPCKAMTVTSKETCEEVHKTAKELKVYTKRIEEIRKSLVGPLNEQVDEINAFAKKVSSPLNATELHFKSELGKWEAILQKERQEAFRRAEEARKQAEADAAKQAQVAKEEAETAAMFLDTKEIKKQEIIQNVEAERKQSEIETQHKREMKAITETKVKGSKQIWAFDVLDIKQIPIEFLTVNEKAINDAIRKNVREISGVKIYQKTVIAL